MSIATTLPQRSQGMILLSITSLASGGRRSGSTGPASSGVAPKAASICRVNSSPKGRKIAVRCVVIGRMDRQPLRRRYGSARHPIPAARCALIRPAHDGGRRTPRHRTDAVSHKIRLVATESRSCSWICVTSCRTSEPKPNATRCEEWQTLFVQKSLVRLGIRTVSSESSVAQGETATRAEFVKCGLSQ